MNNFVVNIEKIKNKSIMAVNTPVAWSDKFNNSFTKNAKIISDLSNITEINGNYYINIFYEKLPPKTKRYKFVEKYNSVDEIHQKGIRTFVDNDIQKYVITYKLNTQDIDYMKNISNEILKFKVSEYNLTEEIFETMPAEIKDYVKVTNDIEKIIDIPTTKIESPVLVRIYKMVDDIASILNQANINPEKFDFDTYLIVLTPEELDRLNAIAPWVVANSLEKGEYSVDEFNFNDYSKVEIEAKPTSGIVGVFDSGMVVHPGFERYIREIVDVRKIKAFSSNEHGTMVSSLIIANDILNPEGRDGLGYFDVKHFEIMEPLSEGGDATTDFEHLGNSIEEAVSMNASIKVWNLSLGANKTPWTLNISALGMKLDFISEKYDVLFVIASGNERNELNEKSLNTPSDALNALSVGSVVPYETKWGKTIFADYSSYGSILHYEKPEVSAFGGPKNISDEILRSMNSSGVIAPIQGTSFSAPKISRLAAYLVEQGYTTLEAKAKIISLANKETKSIKSSAFGWINEYEDHIDLRMTVELSDTKAKYLDINIPTNTKKIILSSSTRVKPIPSLAEEYSISELELSLKQYDPTATHPEREKGKAEAYKVNFDSKKMDEKSKRYYDGKYFSSKRKVYELDKTINIPGFQTAIRFRKQDLFNFKEEREPITKFAIVATFIGDIDVEEFKRKNNEILEIHTETIIES